MECCPLMSDNDRAAVTKRRSFPADQMSWVLLMLVVDARIYEGTECILSHCRNNPVIYWGHCQVEPNQLIHLWSDSGFVFYLPNWESREVLLLNTWGESFVILFIYTRSNQGNQRILYPCRKDQLIYTTNCKVETNQPINSW